MAVGGFLIHVFVALPSISLVSAGSSLGPTVALFLHGNCVCVCVCVHGRTCISLLSAIYCKSGKVHVKLFCSFSPCLFFMVMYYLQIILYIKSSNNTLWMNFHVVIFCGSVLL